MRSPEGKIYVVVTKKTIQQIKTPAELKNYKGRIHDVNDATIAQYIQVLGVKIYADGTLLRTPDYKVYVIKNGEKQYIHNASDLSKYRNHRIINVSYSVLADF